jgi:serine protein kinase
VGDARAVLERISKSQNFDGYRQEHWQGSFEEYLDIVRKNPRVTRTAYQRLYDMILAYGTTPVEGSKDGSIRYRFFDDPENGGADAIFGLTRPLMEIVNVFRSAALKYGSERRVLLLHGPVGSSKSTIARLLKRGLERYSRTEDGALFTYGWKHEDGSVLWCPMHEEPLNLVPEDARAELVRFLNDKQELSNGEQ